MTRAGRLLPLRLPRRLRLLRPLLLLSRCCSWHEGTAAGVGAGGGMVALGGAGRMVPPDLLACVFWFGWGVLRWVSPQLVGAVSQQSAQSAKQPLDSLIAAASAMAMQNGNVTCETYVMHASSIELSACTAP